MRWAGIGAAALFFSLVFPAGALEPESIALQYDAPAACPPEQAFSDEVRARTQLARFTTESARRSFRVSIRETAEQWAGRLEIVDADGHQTVREFSDPSCADVASALALVVAVAIDPKASTLPRGELPPVPAESASVAPAPAPAPAASASALPPAPPPNVVRAPLPAPTWAPPPSAAPREAEPSVPVLSFGLGGVVTTGPAPKALIGPELFAAFELRRRSVLSPLARLSLRAARTGTLGPGFDQARFTWAVAHGEVCPLDLGADPLSVRPCAFADLGVLAVTGTGFDTSLSQTRLWDALGLSALLSARLSRRVYAGAEGGVGAPLGRDTFYFTESKTPTVPHVVYHVPELSVSGGVFLGIAL